MVKKAPRRTAERILEVTLELFNRFGEPNVSTTLISAELGISPGNLYYHYPAKDELINSLYDRYERALNELLNASDGVRDVEDAIEALIINIWVITSSWISFLHTSGIYGENADINRELLQKGIYQIVMLEAPYLRGEARDKLPEMKRHYGGITPPAM